MIRNMREKGMSIKSIARELSISRNSVRKEKEVERRCLVGKQNICPKLRVHVNIKYSLTKP